MKILFIRHGETEVNVKGLSHAQNDTAVLTQRGKEQAKRVSVVCKKHGVEAIFTSPEERAVETAEFIGREVNEKPLIIAELKERNWGEWGGLPWEETKKKLDPMDLQTRYTFIPPAGESWQQMEERLQKALNRITSQGSNAAVVMHGGALRALVPLILQAQKESSFGYDFANASVTIFTYEGGKYREVVTNDISHLSEV